jgi:hypothetical protein
MKGFIVKCLSELVRNNFGEDKWREILLQSGEKPFMVIRAISDIDDQTVFKVIENTCKVLNISKQQACDAFGEYWVNTYAPQIYGAYYHRFKNAKQFIVGMDKVHEDVTRDVVNARPPRFVIEEVDENTIIVNYISTRNMIDFYIGLVKGVGKYYNTPIGIKKLSEEQVELTFS